ncbi:hypothetical protein NE237_023798 [Protea cynaroides]|uniref:Zinc transporter 5 n=1 Tax=Protea cynaroides TaxID=273540 RepID=A0A9Q0K4T2_9MAGN|nr:hypothetical protein NE237_023798 [Protea cynaroides]
MEKLPHFSSIKVSSILPLLLFLPVVEDNSGRNKCKALKYKLAAIASILFGGAVGVCTPVLGKRIPALRPENDIFFLIKAFAAGVILSKGFIYILPDTFNQLTSPCLDQSPWGNFPFAGFFAMLSAIGTLMVDSFAIACFGKANFNKAKPMNSDEENDEGQVRHLHVHTHATYGHAHGSTAAVVSDKASSKLIGHRVISQVLEFGIVAHSVIIGISLDASQSPSKIRPLVVALTFHQFFEGIGLGGCITQAGFKGRAVVTMSLSFSFTIPVGIALGIAITNGYNENSPTALIVEGILDTSAAGILIYMSLVDLFAANFISSRMKNNMKLQIGAHIFLLLGADCMSVLAKWV